MTDTLTEIYCDRFFDTEGTSSAINQVFYSTEERKLFVEFINGSLAGYENVQPEVFSALEVLNSNRLNGDRSASVGGYYNEFFRKNRYFTGINTDNIKISIDPVVEAADDLEDTLTPEQWTALENEYAANTDGVPRFTPEQQSQIAAINNVSAEQISNSAITVGPGSVFIAPVEKRPFGINFIIDTDVEHSWRVFGTNDQDAIDRFAQAIELLGWSVEIKSITRFL